MRRCGVALVILLTIPWLGKAWAQDTISVTAELDKAFITIGEEFRYDVKIKHAPSIELLGIVSGAHLKEFRVKSLKEIGPYEQDGKVVEGRSFTLTAYRLGDYIIDSIVISYRQENGARGKLQTSKLYVTVKSVDPTGSPPTDIRGLKGVVGLEDRRRWIWVMAGIGLVSLIMIWALLSRWKRKVPISPEEMLSPADRARRDLHALFDSKLLTQDNVKEYFVRLSNIIRTYLENQFDFLALESTTREIDRTLKKLDWESSVRADTTRLLWDCDMVKFAKFFPPETSIPELKNLASSIIERTEPRLTEAETVVDKVS